MKLILIEDNPVTSMSLSLFFEDKNYQVLDELSYAEDIVASIEKQTEAANILIMDIMLKGKKNGLDAAEELRNRSINTPILFVSALTDSNTLNRISKISNCDYVTKPYDYEQLVTKMETMVGK